MSNGAFNGLEINTEKYMSLISFVIKESLTVIIDGAPGVGKTQIIQSHCSNFDPETGKFSNKIIHFNKRDYELIFQEERSYQRGDTVAGLPDISPENITQWTIPEWLVPSMSAEKFNELMIRKLKDGKIDKLPPEKKVVLIFDDFHACEEYQQRMLYQFLENYRVNGHEVKKLPIFIIGNFSVNSANVTKLPSPVISRCCGMYQIEPRHDTWLEWAGKNKMNPAIIAFVAAHKEFLFTENPILGEVYPCPRAYEKLNTMMEWDLESAIAILGKKVGAQFKKEAPLINKSNEELLKVTNTPTDLSNLAILALRVGEKKNDKLLYKVLKNNFRREFLVVFVRILLSIDHEVRDYYVNKLIHDKDKNVVQLLTEMKKSFL